MPVRLEHSAAANHCTLHLTGTITLADLERAVDLRLSAGAWALPAVYDTTHADGIALHLVDVEQLVRHVELVGRDQVARGPVIVLAPSEAIFGVASMFEALSAGQTPPTRYTVVQSAGDVDAWLATMS